MRQRGGLVLCCLNGSGPILLLLKQHVVAHNITECYMIMPGGCCVLLDSHFNLQFLFPSGACPSSHCHRRSTTYGKTHGTLL